MLGAGHTLRIAKDGFSYKSLNGKVDVDMKFAEIGSLFLTNYCSQNFHYRVMLRDLNMKNMSVPELDLPEPGITATTFARRSRFSLPLPRANWELNSRTIWTVSRQCSAQRSVRK